MQKSKLGIVFIVISIVCLVGGVISSPKSNIEKFQERKIEIDQESVDQFIEGAQRFTGEAAALLWSSAEQRKQDVHNDEEKLQNIRMGRYIKMACFFIPAGVLFVLGLVLMSSAKPNQ